MATQVKVPKEVMDVVYEWEALKELAAASGFIKAIYYRSKAQKAHALIHRAMHAAHPATKQGKWSLNIAEGIMVKHEDAAAVKKPRKPRTPKQSATQQGDAA